MGLVSGKQFYDDLTTKYQNNLSEHPCLRYTTDTLTKSLLDNVEFCAKRMCQELKVEKINLYDMGAKYASHRTLYARFCPSVRYHGVRLLISSQDIAYRSANEPHPDDIVEAYSYDEFYNCPRCFSIAVFLDSAYYVTPY